jgi:protein O-mannosyl-transferase
VNPPPETPARNSRLADALACGGIAAATVASFWNGLGGTFLFDDVGTVLDNPTIRHLWPIWAPFLPPAGGYTVSGRPVLNFTLAVNHALGGTNPWGYHALNLLIHVLAALVLFGVAKRLARLAGIWPAGTTGERWVAFTVALLWAVHPLQTESVTYVSQRAESLMGLLYLLTFYGFLRSVEGVPGFGRGWPVLSTGACLLGMATKEVMVTAPVLILLFDRTFVSGGFGQALRQRGRYYGALVATWILLALLVLRTGTRAGTAGFGSGVAWWAYALTQLRGVTHYLRLSVWPHPLVADYGRTLGGPTLDLVLDGILLTALLGATVWALFGRPANAARERPIRLLGFAGAAFFLILSPSSSVVPVVTEVIAEHRMYLPLAAVIATIVIGGCGLLRSWAVQAAPVFLAVLCLIVAPAFGALTHVRNAVYQNVLTFWTDAAMRVPENAGAHNNLGNAYAERGDQDRAILEYRIALELVPEFSDANADLGNALVRKGLYAEALEHYRVALKSEPNASAVRYAYGYALLRHGDTAEARREFETAVRLNPANADAWSNLGDLSAGAEHWSEAARDYETAVQLRPDSADVRVNLGSVYAQLGRGPEAIEQFQAALRLQPGAADVHNNLGGLLAEVGRYRDARAQFEEALRLKPDYKEARDNLEHVNQLEGVSQRR